jgi:hypothetical protein
MVKKVRSHSFYHRAPWLRARANPKNEDDVIKERRWTTILFVVFVLQEIKPCDQED